MLLRTDDTIVAIATAAGGAPRGLVRVSGDRARAIAEGLFRPVAEPFTWPRLPSAVAGSVLLNAAGDALPCELYVWPSLRSYTQQPTLEFHTLGSPPLLQLLVQQICRHGARTAEPGEFTLRAFLAGRLDLTQAEAVLGVIEAASERELNVALRQLAGGLKQRVQMLREQLLELLAHLEAGLDFVEEDIEFIERAELLRALQAVAADVRTLLDQMQFRGAAGGRPRVVLYGLPNSGKSSLFNALTAGQQALVSPVAGTTRDFLTATLRCGEVACELIDTAGLDPSSLTSEPDRQAQAFAREQIEQAHLRVLCVDGSEAPSAWLLHELQRPEENRLVAVTKADLGLKQIALPAALLISSHSGEGLAELRTAIGQRLEASTLAEGDALASTADRCRDSLERAHDSVAAALNLAASGGGEEFIAGEIRVALEELGRIAGAVYTDDLLDRIFSRFCIGK